MIELFPIKLPTHDLFRESSSSEYEIWSSFSDVMHAPAFPNEVTRATHAAVDPSDKSSNVARGDMSEGQEVKCSPTAYSCIKARATHEPPSLEDGLMLLIFEANFECARSFSELFRNWLSIGPGDGLVFDDDLPWTAPEDVAADHGEYVARGWDDEVRDVFQWKWNDGDVKPMPVDMDEQQTNLVLLTSSVELPDGLKELRGESVWDTAVDFSQLVVVD